MNNTKNYVEYRYCVDNLLKSPVVLKMGDYIQHSDITTLQHCIFVSYVSFCLAKFFGCDYNAAARGGLLHDLFLYDWHKCKKGTFHGYRHPMIALVNAENNFTLSEIEKDIIIKHMWPLTLMPPKFKESFIVCISDKICAIMEIFNACKLTKIKRIMQLNAFAGE